MNVQSRRLSGYKAFNVVLVRNIGTPLLIHTCMSFGFVVLMCLVLCLCKRRPLLQCPYAPEVSPGAGSV